MQISYKRKKINYQRTKFCKMKKPTSTKLELMTTFYISDKKIEIITFCRVGNTLFFTSESLIFLEWNTNPLLKRANCSFEKKWLELFTLYLKSNNSKLLPSLFLKEQQERKSKKILNLYTFLQKSYALWFVWYKGTKYSNYVFIWKSETLLFVTFFTICSLSIITPPKSTVM